MPKVESTSNMGGGHQISVTKSSVLVRNLSAFTGLFLPALKSSEEYKVIMHQMLTASLTHLTHM